MKIKKKNENIGIRLAEELKQDILEFSFKKNKTITEVLLDGFELLKEQERENNYDPRE